MLFEGDLMLSGDDDRMVASVMVIRPHEIPVSVLIIGNRGEVVGEFAECVEGLADSRKMYQGKKIELGDEIAFLSAPRGKAGRTWRLAPSLKTR